DEGTVIREASCTKVGKQKFTCSECKKTEIRDIPMVDHIPSEERVYAEKASCYKEGYTGDVVCASCGKILEEGKVLSKTDHTWDEGVVTITPSCEKEGEKTIMCDVCGEFKIEKVPATGHDFTGKETVKKAATCTEDGEKEVCCKNCDAKETVKIPAMGHDFTGKETVKKAATCTEAGEKEVCCKNCDAKETVKIPATGHKWDNGTVTSKATYTTEGSVVYTCKTCGEKKSEKIAKLAMPKPGTTFSYKGNKYQITKDGVSLVKAKAAKKIVVPDTVKYNSSLTYKVTAVKAKAVSTKKVTSLTIGKNVKSISKNAIYKCKNLKSISVKTTLLKKGKASKKSFNGISKKASMKVPKKVKKAYKKIFKGMKIK
ncbi:MAG: leucine-rich repeat domain-containing protein, partial [Eubacterium sp.]|nr:leucine-rich repeat domain-containing protein [Eubacterium sp.]